MNRIDRFVTGCMLVMSAALMSGCSEDGGLQSRQPKDNYIKIISMKPALTETLVAGTNVSFEIEVKYSIKEESGVMALVIQRAESSLMPLANEIVMVTSGEGRLMLGASVDIPDTHAVQILTPLTPQGMNQTSVVDSRIYKVAPSPGQEV